MKENNTNEIRVARHVEDIADYIDRYRVCSLSNLLNHKKEISKEDMIGITSLLRRKGRLFFLKSKDGTAKNTFYYSATFNPNKRNVVYDNERTAICKCLTCLEAFRKYYNIVYETLDFFPSTIKFGIKNNDGSLANAQLIYLPYTENNEMAVYMSRFFNQNYDNKFNIMRYVCFSIPAMANEGFAKSTIENIPNVVGFAHCQPNEKDVVFYNPEELLKKDVINA